MLGGLRCRKARCFSTTRPNAALATPPLFTEPGWNLHMADEIGIDDFQAMRSPDERYRTAALRALWDTEKIRRGGFYHDGRFAALDDVVEHYNGHLKLNLTDQEKDDLIEYLKSI
jgi:cytochrome c peroxidase